MKFFAVVTIAVLFVIGAAAAYHYYSAPSVEDFHLDIHLLNNTTSQDIGNISVSSYHYDIHYSWFNVSLGGYANYSLSFDHNVAYSGHYNLTAHVMLNSNLSITFNSDLNGSTKGGIYIS